jgi:ribosome-associated translation inhibitor RaiA
MNSNVSITYRHLTHSEALDSAIHREAQALEEHHGHPLTFHVTIEPQRQTSDAKQWRVHLEAIDRGDVTVADRTPSGHDGHEDVFMEMREAFRALRRQLDDQAAKRRSRRHSRTGT